MMTTIHPSLLVGLSALGACAPALEGEGIDAQEKGKAPSAEWCATHPGHARCPVVEEEPAPSDPVEMVSARVMTQTFSEGAYLGNLGLNVIFEQVNGGGWDDSFEGLLTLGGGTEIEPGVYEGVGTLEVWDSAFNTFFMDREAIVTFETQPNPTAAYASSSETIIAVWVEGNDSGLPYTITPTGYSISTWSGEPSVTLNMEFAR